MRYKMRAQITLYPGTAAWHFLHIPKERSAELRAKYNNKHKGWNSLPVEVTIGKTSWKTSIFYERKSESYLLPVKAEVRQKETIFAGDTINFLIKVRI